MSQQFAGVPQTLKVRTLIQGAPSADGDGTAMSQFASTLPGPANKPKRFLVRVNVPATGTSCVLALYVKDRAISGTGAWGQTVDAGGNIGSLGNGAALLASHTYFFVFEDVGNFAEIVLVHTTDTGGTPVVTAEIYALLEIPGGV